MRVGAILLGKTNTPELTMAYERTASFSNFSSAVAVPTYFDSVVCFSRPWVLTKPKFRLAFVQPSALQGNGNRFSRRNAPKQPTRNTVGKKRVRQEDMDFDYLFGNFLPRPDFFNDLNCRVVRLRFVDSFL